MDESDGLENRYGGNLIVGSNPTPSATFRHGKGSQISVYEPSSLVKSPNVDQSLINSQTKFILGRKCFVLDHLCNGAQMREFIAPLCVKTHSYAIALLSSDSRYCIDINGYVIVLKQHF